MASKDDLQSDLKKKFGINKNISASLSAEECEKLYQLLCNEPAAVKLVSSYADKNSSLGQNNANYARARSQAERRLEDLKVEYLKIEKSIESITQATASLEDKKKFLEEEQKKLEAEVKRLSVSNQSLASKVQDLTTQNEEITVANAQLKKENKDLKNIVDQIRLRLARDTKMLLEYEDSEIRKALIRLFRWALG